MKKLSWTLALALAVSVFTGCKSEEPAPRTTTEPAKAAPTMAAPSELAPEEPKTPGALTAAELGDEAEATISPDQLENELDRLEAEITLGL